MKIKAFLKIMLQILIIFLFWGLGCAVSLLLHSHLPGSIWGIVLLVASLGLGIIKIEHVEEGASAIFRELVLLFLPLVITVVEYKDLFLRDGWQLVVSIVFGTALVMVSTSLTIHLLYKKRGTS